jgi:type I restriction-modification system DNA methylase subunit
MPRCITSRLAFAALIASAVIPLSTRAQSQDTQTQSVADAARRAREQKKAADKLPSPIITNDTLKPAAPAPSSDAAAVPAPSAQPAADSSNPATSAAPAPAGPSAAGSPAAEADQKTKDSPEVARQKQQLAEAQKELELLQRELALEQDNVYSKNNYASDTAGKAKLDDLKQQVAGKQEALDALKARLEALLGAAGDKPPATPPAPPQP